MLKKSITYTDFNGNERTEDHYFNLSKVELTEMQFSINGGFQNLIQQIISEQDNVELFKLFKELILKSYGRKSLDGKRFEKSEEISKEFEQSPAYEVLFMELISGDDAGEKVAKFAEAILPQDLVEEEKKNGNIRNIEQSSQPNK